MLRDVIACLRNRFGEYSDAEWTALIVRAVAENSKQRFEILSGLSQEAEPDEDDPIAGRGDAAAGDGSTSSEAEATLLAVRAVGGRSLPSVDPFCAMRLITGNAFKSLRCLAHCTEGTNIPSILRYGLLPGGRVVRAVDVRTRNRRDRLHDMMTAAHPAVCGTMPGVRGSKKGETLRTPCI